ncbi:MAG: hypothetical protein ABEJ68_10330 [Halobacteriaceae archaeon]
MNDRAVSTVVTWTLTLLITTLLITGLLVATGNQIESRTESVTQTELSVVGQRVAADLAAADRLAASGATAVRVDTSLPARVASGQYRVRLTATNGSATIVVLTDDRSVRVPVGNRTAVRNSTVSGGDLHVVLDGGALEVASA